MLISSTLTSSLASRFTSQATDYLNLFLEREVCFQGGPLKLVR